MCGITGFIDRRAARSRDAFTSDLNAMCAAIRHRGPDDSGTLIDVDSGVGLGFMRLSIVDLSAAGHQPMDSATGRYTIIFNGEVYNFERLRAALDREQPGLRYRGHSDTEMILACIETWGLHRALQEFIGMFAFALWDRQNRTVSLVRDRVGVKPLYYGWSGDVLLFGSELKAVREHAHFSGEIDREALALMIQHAYVPSPRTIYREFRKVVPGSILEIPIDDVRSPKSIPYWTARATAAHGQQNLITDVPRALRELEELLRDAVALRMIADVPLGVFLSGGIDSSLVTALMQAQSTRPTKTFTIGFHEDAYDEAKHAAAVARHLGTDHTQIYVTAEEAQKVIPTLPRMFDEPFGDSSAIPTHLVSKLARREVTVALSGDGGDELFGGYNRHRWTEPVWNASRMLPRPMRNAAAALFQSMASPQSPGGRLAQRMLPESVRPRLLGDKLAKMSKLASARSPIDAYRLLVSQSIESESLVKGASAAALIEDDGVADEAGGFAHRMMLLDLITYLPDDILAKVDRASMAVSLEAREPLLDHRLIEYAWRLPLSMKIRRGQTKWALRQVLYRYVPAALIDRPKMGFSIPLDSWLRTGLRDWAESLLNADRLRAERILRVEPIRAMWEDHISGRRDRHHALWNILMFQAWLDEQQSPAVHQPANREPALASPII
ncbi:MAG: asparagine synthase (glutamine-hydrolyzing) [Acidobacteriota bacterium]|nr:asparagine synthase (glutamine-hydrolyzing) [Acidobacteriota bacterium]